MEEKLLDLIARIFDVDISTLTPEVRFNEDLDSESLQKFMIIAELEEWSGKQIEYHQFNDCKTIGEAVEFAKKLME